jgi:hypothetical protein
VISLAPRQGHKVVTSEHGRHSAWIGEGAADPFTYLHVTFGIRKLKLCGEDVRAGIRNMVIELGWLKTKVNNMLIENEWLHMSVDRGWKWSYVIHTDHAWFLQSHTWTPRNLFLLTGMQTWIMVVNENLYTLRLAGGLPVYLVGEKGYDFAAYEWPWTKTVSRLIPYILFSFQRRRTILLGFQTTLNWNTNCYYKRFSTLVCHVHVSTSLITNCDSTTTTPKCVSNDKCYTARQLGTWKCFTSLKEVPTYA